MISLLNEMSTIIFLYLTHFPIIQMKSIYDKLKKIQKYLHNLH